VGAAGGERERAAEDGARHVFDALPPQGADRWSLIDVTTDPRRFVVGLAQQCLCPVRRPIAGYYDAIRGTRKRALYTNHYN